MMLVAFVFRRKRHIVAIYDAAYLLWFGRSLEGFSFKHYVLVRQHDIFLDALIEPSPIGMHVERWFAEHPSNDSEHWEYGIVKNAVASLCQSRMPSFILIPFILSASSDTLSATLN